MKELTTADDIRHFLDQNRFAVIFKAGTCRQTESALNRLTPFFKKYPAVPAARINVVKHPEVSKLITSLSGRKHESPQVLLFQDAKCFFDAHHWRIDAIPLIDALEGLIERENS
jgi:bacillithiol system protein YtxJ